MRTSWISWPALVLAVTVVTGVAHAGLWVERRVPSLSYWDERHTVAGDRCAATTTEHADSLWIFDAELGRWLVWGEESLPSYVDLLAEGRTVLLMTDSLAVAHVAGSPAVRPLPLHEGLIRSGSYECGARCAAVVTRHTMHVFDAARDAWLSHPLPEMTDPVYCQIACGDEYVAFAVHLSAGRSVNVFYNMSPGTFTVVENGLRPGDLLTNGYPLNGGCAGLVDERPDDDHYLFLGWSARTGDVVTYLMEEDGPFPGGGSTHPHPSYWIHRPLTSVEVITSVLVNRYTARSIHCCYDTWTGNLTVHDRTYDSNEEMGSSCRGGGGRYTVSSYPYKAGDDTWDVAVVVYIGASGNVQTFMTDIPQGDPDTAWFFGDHAFLVAQPGENVHVFHVQDDAVSATIVPITSEVVSNYKAGPGYIAFSEGPADGDTMTAHVYLLDSGTWRTFTHPAGGGSLEQGTPDVLYYDSTSIFPHEVVFYSPSLDLVERVTNSYYSGCRSAGPLAFTFESGAAWLFDAWSGYLVHQPGERAGGDSGILQYVCKTPEGPVTAYSAVTASWHPLAESDGLHPIISTSTIGIAKSTGAHNPTVAAFDPLDGSWATVTCQGDWYGRYAGQRVLVVVCEGFSEDYLYGYVPDMSEVAIEPPVAPPPAPTGHPASLAITAVEPNPANPRAVVRFHLPRPGRTVLDVVDLRGRRVARLVDGELPAGDHHVTWDGSGDDGRPRAGGTYLVLLRQDTRRVVRKVTLVR